MTSELKCPFCQQDLRTVLDSPFYTCDSCGYTGYKQLWQALIRTKQDLEIARQALKEYANEDEWGCIVDDRDRVWHTYWYFDGCDDGGWVNAQKALEQINHKE